LAAASNKWSPNKFIPPKQTSRPASIFPTVQVYRSSKRLLQVVGEQILRNFIYPNNTESEKGFDKPRKI
jgi:hypothetical protein